jgi:hypothetical protein
LRRELELRFKWKRLWFGQVPEHKQEERKEMCSKK